MTNELVADLLNLYQIEKNLVSVASTGNDPAGAPVKFRVNGEPNNMELHLSIPQNSTSPVLDLAEMFTNDIMDRWKLPKKYQQARSDTEYLEVKEHAGERTLTIKEPVLGMLAQFIKMPDGLDEKVIAARKDEGLEKFPPMQFDEVIQGNAQKLAVTYKRAFGLEAMRSAVDETILGKNNYLHLPEFTDERKADMSLYLNNILSEGPKPVGQKFTDTIQTSKTGGREPE